MAKPEWGAKRLCPSCGVRFYDLMRDPVPCPSCGSAFSLESLSERKGSAPARARAKPEKAAPAPAAAESEDAELIDDESESGVAGDDDLLDDEEDADDGDLGEIGDAVSTGKEDDET